MPDRTYFESQFGSGLKEAYDLTVYSAAFTTDLRYNGGNSYVLILTGVDEDGEPAEEMLAVGADWESLDGGHTLSHPRKSGNINRNSTYARWCYAAAEACEKVSSDYVFDKDFKQAAIWVNTKWRLAEKKIGEAWTNRATKEENPARFRLVPDEFLGLVDEDGAVVDSQPAQVASPAPKSSPSPKVAEALAKAAAAKVEAASGSNGSSPVQTRLANLASTNDFDTFIGLAFNDDEVLNDPDLTESLIDSGPNGFYAQHRS